MDADSPSPGKGRKERAAAAKIMGISEEDKSGKSPAKVSANASQDTVPATPSGDEPTVHAPEVKDLTGVVTPKPTDQQVIQQPDSQESASATPASVTTGLTNELEDAMVSRAASKCLSRAQDNEVGRDGVTKESRNYSLFRAPE